MKTWWIQSFLAALLLISIPLSAAEERESFGGIGIVVAQLYDQESPDHRGELVVLGFGSDSPAPKAGLRSGDVIVAIDNRNTNRRSFADIVQQELRGTVGKAVTLRVRRIGQEKLFEVKVTRIEMKG